MYDHLKHIEMMQQKLENLESSSIGEGPTELIEQLVDEVVDFVSDNWLNAMNEK